MLQANGFYGSRGISGLIPEGYTLLEQRFWRGVKRSRREWKDGHGVQLHEWARDGWTYHAKGLWVAPDHDEPPMLNLFGSTNLNSRSANLDTELSFVMITTNSDQSAQLRKQLAEEVKNLRRHAVPWLGEARKVQLRTKALVGLVGGML